MRIAGRTTCQHGLVVWFLATGGARDSLLGSRYANFRHCPGPGCGDRRRAATRGAKGRGSTSRRCCSMRREVRAAGLAARVRLWCRRRDAPAVADASADAWTIAFASYVQNPSTAWRLLRVLRPGGRLAISVRTAGASHAACISFFRHILPRIGRASLTTPRHTVSARIGGGFPWCGTL